MIRYKDDEMTSGNDRRLKGTDRDGVGETERSEEVEVSSKHGHISETK